MSKTKTLFLSENNAMLYILSESIGARSNKLIEGLIFVNL